MSEVSTASSTRNCCTLHPSSLEFFAVSQAGLVRRFCHGSKASVGKPHNVVCRYGECSELRDRLLGIRMVHGADLPLPSWRRLQAHAPGTYRSPSASTGDGARHEAWRVPEKCDQVAFEYMNRVMIWIRSQLSALSQRVPLRAISFPDFLGGTVFPSFF